MTRLIDADALMDTIIHRAYSVTDYWNTRDAGMFLYGIEQAVNEQPTVDAVEVIRCKDCKHAEHEEDGDIMCTFWDFCDCNHHVLGNGYCDRAERREE